MTWTDAQDHIALFLSGATVIGAIAHAVNTFPTPANKYGAWALGWIQWIVGQRVASKNTLKGEDTEAYAIPNKAQAKINGTGPGTGN